VYIAAEKGLAAAEIAKAQRFDRDMHD